MDVDEAITWYELRKTGLGKRFYQSLEKALHELAINPLAFFSVTTKVKRILIKNFPYKVFYTVAEKKVVVLGVVHSKRSGKYIRRRLR